MKYYLITFGCQMNESDSEKIANTFKKSGYQSVSNMNGADLIVVNMCSVRQSAVNRVYGIVEKIKSRKLKIKSILTGCILRKDRKKFEKLFDYVLDIKDLTGWKKFLNINSSKTHDREFFMKKIGSIPVDLSALVPIMTGCNNFCSYCVVPYTKGKEISRPVEEIICEVNNLVKNGVKEIWLLGQNVNSYKGYKDSFKQTNKETKPTPKKYDRLNCELSFPQLLRKINEIPGKFWIRFTSSHPKDFSDDLIKVIKSCEKITPYLNLPVQAGDDKILKKMNRPYTIAQYKKIIKKVRKEIPDICLSTDVIVGFPDETKKQFENTIKLFEEIKYDMAYISQYSPRPGTAGAKLLDNVSLKEKDRRKKVLNETLKQTALENNKKYINKNVEVLVEELKIKNQELRILYGRTKTNKRIEIHNSQFLIHNSNPVGKFIKVKITDALPWRLKGEIKKAVLDSERLNR